MAVGSNTVSDGPMDILSYATEILLHSPENQNCTDAYGNVVLDGEQFLPIVDPCQTCHCQNGTAVMCKSVLCLPPTCRVISIVNTECCKFVCIDLPHDVENIQNGTRFIERDVNQANFGVRLVASVITSLIVIFLLIFMVHRLRRRRRTMINIRRLNDERRSEDDDLAYMTNPDIIDVGLELPPYEDLPPPYSPAKPLDITDDLPPPYEVSNNVIQPSAVNVTERQLTNSEENEHSLPPQNLPCELNLSSEEYENTGNVTADEQTTRLPYRNNLHTTAYNSSYNKPCFQKEHLHTSMLLETAKDGNADTVGNCSTFLAPVEAKVASCVKTCSFLEMTEDGKRLVLSKESLPGRTLKHFLVAPSKHNKIQNSLKIRSLPKRWHSSGINSKQVRVHSGIVCSEL